MKRIGLLGALGALLFTQMLTLNVSAATSVTTYNEERTTIQGGGNPPSGWAIDSNGEIEVGLRAKNRTTGSTVNVNGVYHFDTALAPRGEWNYDFHLNSDIVNGTAPLSNYYWWLSVDRDPSQGISVATVNPLANWTDNSFGDNSTGQGAGVEPADVLQFLAFPGIYNKAQNSQNITFGDTPGGALPLVANATYDDELYATAGPDSHGTKLVSVGITVVVGLGGAPVPDADHDGVPDSLDQCPGTAANSAVNAHGCSIQDLVNVCAVTAVTHGDYVSCITDLAGQLVAEGLITNKQRGKMISEAGTSSVGK